MALFFYTGKAEDGKQFEANLDAPSRYEALSVLRDRGITVLKLEEAAKGAAAPKQKAVAAAKELRSRRMSRKVSLADRAIFCRQLSVSVSAGVPLREALESLADDMDHSSFKLVVTDVVSKLHEGKTFSEALNLHVRVFTPLFVALIRTAEESGTMPRTLDDLARTMERTERLVRKIRSITSYPLFVFGFFLIVCVIMTVVIVPQFERVFPDVASLPLLTRTVFRINRFMLSNIVWIGLMFTAALTAVVFFARTPAGRLKMDELTLKVPMLGSCVRMLAMARFSRNLAMMLQGGVSITTAIEIAAATCGNLALERAFLAACERIVSGMNMSGSLAQDPAFPRLVVRMVSVGEASGRLPEVLDRVSNVYEDQVEGKIMTAMALFEPIAIVFFGAVVLVLVLAIYIPIFTMATRMR